MSLAPGDKLGPYEILALIGQGAMGEVSRARDTKLKCDVASKVLPETFSRNPGRMARFQREAELPSGANGWIVSRGGALPRWQGDGKKLFYETLDGTLMAVDVTLDPVCHAGAARPLFKAPAPAVFDVTADGKRFLMSVPVSAGSQSSEFTVVLNWQAGLKK